MNANEIKLLLIEYKKLGLKAELVRDKLVKLTKFDPDNVENYVKLSICYLAQQDYYEAMKYIKRALIFEPGNENYWLLQGAIFEEKKSYLNAFEAYYFAYRLGSEVAEKKLRIFCENEQIKNLSNDINEKIIKFKETLC